MKTENLRRGDKFSLVRNTKFHKKCQKFIVTKKHLYDAEVVDMNTGLTTFVLYGYSVKKIKLKF